MPPQIMMVAALQRTLEIRSPQEVLQPGWLGHPSAGSRPGRPHGRPSPGSRPRPSRKLTAVVADQALELSAVIFVIDLGGRHDGSLDDPVRIGPLDVPAQPIRPGAGSRLVVKQLRDDLRQRRLISLALPVLAQQASPAVIVGEEGKATVDGPGQHPSIADRHFKVNGSSGYIFPASIKVEHESVKFAEFYESAREDCRLIVLLNIGGQQLAEDLVAQGSAKAPMSWQKGSQPSGAARCLPSAGEDGILRIGTSPGIRSRRLSETAMRCLPEPQVRYQLATLVRNPSRVFRSGTALLTEPAVIV